MGRWVLAVLVLAACGHAPRVERTAPEVAWGAVGPDAFARARREGRLVLLSVETRWCHWCHVMEARTFGDPAVRARIAESFVAVRADADAEPDLAQRYFFWGWPATIVLSADGIELAKVRGFSPPERFGTLLARLVDDARAGRSRPIELEAPPSSAEAAGVATLRARVREQLDALYDPNAEGWGAPIKYPLEAPVLDAFARAHASGEPLWAERATATLRAEQALIDPIGGGMFQYSVRGDWSHPHFEKLAAVQAGAIEAYAVAYRVTGDAAFREVAEGIARYVVEVLRAPDGTFYASQDADGAGPEGERYYTLDAARRARAEPPRVDETVYVEHTARLATALVHLADATGDDRWLAIAAAAVDLLRTTHATAIPGAFAHRARPGSANDANAPIYLADEVELLRAQLALYQATGDGAPLAHAREIADFMFAHLRREDGALLGRTPDRDAVGVLARVQPAFVGGSRAIAPLVVLGAVTHEARYREAAAAAAMALGRDATRQGRLAGDLSIGLELLDATPVTVTVTGPANDLRTIALHRAARLVYEPRRAIAIERPGDADAQYPSGGAPAVYACTESTCSSPAFTPEDVLRAVASVTAARAER